MKADRIKNIIKSYGELPYECILIDGPWGIGKSYAVSEAIDGNNCVCNISMFGLKSAQDIYHEVFFQLVLRDKNRVGEKISKAVNAAESFSNNIAVTKGIINSLMKEKELFLDVSKRFRKLHLIIIDDLERLNTSIELEEVFGIIDELKRCNYVKVILVANTDEIEKEDVFKKYSEKVIDKIYYITERSEKIEWAKMKIHHGFITEFLKMHQVKNLRTLQKAQNFYDDVMVKLRVGYRDDFYDEIRLACFAIVVESIENLYYKELEDKQHDSMTKAVQISSNRLEIRIISYYLRGTRISNNMVELLQKYYKNEVELITEEIDAEHQIFIHAGEKANFYKTDEELRIILPNLADKIRQETSVTKAIKYADEYFIWSNHLQLDTSSLATDYKAKLYNMIYLEVMQGKTEYLTYGIEIFHIQSPTNKSIIKEVKELVKIESVKAYVAYLSKNTQGEQAYQYSYILRGFSDNSFLNGAISGIVDALYNEKSFPIKDVTEQQYRTAYNIMYVLYHENKEKFLAYCEEVKTKCDNMATHRIDVLLEEITGEKRL